jgi:DNA modification methylase/ParB-like chromosome segregation protein Spo0J
VNRHLDTGDTVEVNRLCTPENATKNVASMLYAAARRSAKELGYRRILTYVRAEEDGTSLKAAGWQITKERVRESYWHLDDSRTNGKDRPGAKRREQMGGQKVRWEAELTSAPPRRAWKNRIVSHGEEAPDQLLANPRNWRIHPQFQQEALKGVLDEIGWVTEVIVNQTTGHVIDGHLRAAVAISKGEKRVPVTYVKLSPDEERLVLATLDPLASLAVSDHEALNGLLADVQPFVSDEQVKALLDQLTLGGALEVAIGDLDPNAPGTDAALTSQPYVSEEEAQHLDDLAEPLHKATPDKLADLRQRWGVQVGDRWWIPSGTAPGGRHLLVVGDCTKTETLAKMPEGMNFDLVVTSPPYGTGQVYEIDRESGEAAREDSDRGRKSTEESLRNLLWLLADFVAAWKKRAPQFVVNLADMTVGPEVGKEFHTYGELVDLFATGGITLASTRIWKKDPVWVGTNPYWLNSYKPVHEYEYIGHFFDRERLPYKKVAERVPEGEEWRYRGLWEMRSVASQGDGKHPAAYPVELPRRCLLLFSDPGQRVADPFLGSGTTMVVAEKLGRVCVGFEKDPTFAAVSLERMSNLGLSPQKDA